MSRPTDVVVVGGGVIGCSLARELAARGLSVTLVERGEPGAEASGAAAGLLAPQAEGLAPGPFFDLALESRGLYPEWSEELREETGIDVGYRRTGILRCGLPGVPLRLKSFLWQRQAGLSVEPKDAAGIAALSNGRLSSRIREGLFFPAEAIVDCRRLARALRTSLDRRGVVMRIATTVKRFRLRANLCQGVQTESEIIQAGAVVNAAGAWAGFDVGLPVCLPVEPVRGQIVELGVEGKPFKTVIQSAEAYLVPREMSLLVGSTMESVGFRKEVTAGAVEKLIAAAARLVPALASARFLGAWAGLRPGTPDGLPILGASPIGRLYLATGHFRNGILLAPVTARLLADEITGKGSRDLAPFSVGRFERRGDIAEESVSLPPEVFR